MNTRDSLKSLFKTDVTPIPVCTVKYDRIVSRGWFSKIETLESGEFKLRCTSVRRTVDSIEYKFEDYQIEFDMLLRYYEFDFGHFSVVKPESGEYRASTSNVLIVKYSLNI